MLKVGWEVSVISQALKEVRQGLGEADSQGISIPRSKGKIVSP